MTEPATMVVAGSFAAQAGQAGIGHPSSNEEVVIPISLPLGGVSLAVSLTSISFGLVNAYLLRGREGDILIDTGLPGCTRRLLRALSRAGSSPDRISLIILTHVHFDHIGNLQAIRALTQAPVLVHRSDAPWLVDGRITLPAGQTLLARAIMGMGAPLANRLRFAPCTPEIIVDDMYSLSALGVAATVLHTPGHTKGSISVVLDNGDAIIGDLAQNGWGFGMGLGRIMPPLADHPEAVMPSWQRLIGAGAQQLYPGHGRPFPVAELHHRVRA